MSQGSLFVESRFFVESHLLSSRVFFVFRVFTRNLFLC